jgi:hypothetical protein
MKVGDLVRIKSRFRNAPIGLIVSIDHHPRNAAPVKVQWLDGNYDQYRNMNELEVVND